MRCSAGEEWTSREVTASNANVHQESQCRKSQDL